MHAQKLRVQVRVHKKIMVSVRYGPNAASGGWSYGHDLCRDDIIGVGDHAVPCKALLQKM